jgi:hypothetical protein
MSNTDVQLTCEYCGTTWTGPAPKMCCNGNDCSCRGVPIEPVVCSMGCYDAILFKAQINVLHEALVGLVSLGRKDLSNPKYDAYFQTANEALNQK